MTGVAHTSRLSRPARLTLVCLAAVALVGLIATVHGFTRAGGFPRLTPTLLAATPLVVGATFANLLLRFVRWQFLLRRLDVRLPTLGPLAAFVGSFAFLPVPLYVGQLVARVRLLAPEPAHVSRIVLAFFLEQASNVWALTLLATPLLGWPALAAALGVAAVAVAAPLRRSALVLLEKTATPIAAMLATGPLESSATPPIAGGVLAASAALSLGAWSVVLVALLPLPWALGAPIDAAGGMAAVARSILVGAVSLVPLGASVSGLALYDSLQTLGTTAAAAAATVFVFRAATTWLSVAVGGLALLARRRDERRAGGHDHFDAIDACYDAWLPAHYRDHLVGRKTAPIIARLRDLGPAPRALDVGCGRGWYAARLREAGVTITGLDASPRQLAATRELLGGRVALVRGSALSLPFTGGAFDFAYVINVLHHVATPAAQRDAVAEIGRVVRPGGLVFVHEMSVRNPLFRLYLEYVYPVTKGIEEGTEYYIDPRRLADVPGLRLADVQHFTFVPDFVPRALLPACARLERRLERSALAPWAAHVVAVYERTGA